MHVEELSSYLRPTGRFGDAVAGEQLVKPGIAVGMNNAAKLLQMIPGMLPLAVRRKEEQRCRWPLAGEGALVANIRPYSPGPGLAGPRRQDRLRRVVDVQYVRRHHRAVLCVDERLLGRDTRADPAG